MKHVLSCLLALLMAWNTPAWANVSRDQAAAIASQATGGRVLSIERIQRDGQTFWRVKLLTPQGEVKVLWIDTASGQAR
ncbi:MAG: peptidase [Comamonadaceae bacterium CG1_02_60_18]|nr:MAG: peptidase [Comamonadaceae bacterium CG1_02_60_18]PIQ52612.1 MAG: peptidase [Comamonadaceae bacterium CG12_big_fil_rev_8_21_14_0_65_59_15]